MIEPRPAHRTVAALTLASCVLLAACSSDGGGLSLNGSPSLRTASVALEAGSYDLALRICTDVVARDGDNAQALVCQGDALAALGRNAEATASYRDALRVDRRSTPAILGLGRAALRNDPAEAERLFLSVLANEPRNTTALNDLGIARDLQGRHGDAQTAYAEAIAAAPDDRAAQVNLALSLAMSGNTSQAVRIMRPIANRPGATAKERHDLAAVLAMDGHDDEAAQVLRPELDGSQADDAVAGYRALPRR